MQKRKKKCYDRLLERRKRREFLMSKFSLLSFHRYITAYLDQSFMLSVSELYESTA